MKPLEVASKILGYASAFCILGVPVSFAVMTYFYPASEGRFVQFVVKSPLPQYLFFAGAACWIARVWVDRVVHWIARRSSDSPNPRGYAVVPRHPGVDEGTAAGSADRTRD
jgi:hypothetical protein